MMHYHFKSLNKECFGDFVDLHQRVYQNKEKSSFEFLSKKYNIPFSNQTYQAHLAYYKEQAVAYHGLIPYPMKDVNTSFFAMQSCDGMTDANHRGKKLFRQLYQLTKNEIARSKLAFIFGFPNQNSFPVFKKYTNAQFLGQMQCYYYKTPNIPFSKMMNKLSFTKQYMREKQASLMASYPKAAPFSSLTNEGWIGVDRSALFYDYKKITNNYLIEIAGNPVWLKITNALEIGDLIVDSQAGFKLVFKELKEIASQLGLSKIMFQSSPGLKINEYFKRDFEHLETWPIMFIPNQAIFPKERLKFTLGDVDIY